MEICDNCGKAIPRKISIWGGCGNMDDGYFCSDKCYNKLIKEKYGDEEIE